MKGSCCQHRFRSGCEDLIPTLVSAPWPYALWLQIARVYHVTFEAMAVSPRPTCCKAWSPKRLFHDSREAGCHLLSVLPPRLPGWFPPPCFLLTRPQACSWSLLRSECHTCMAVFGSSRLNSSRFPVSLLMAALVSGFRLLRQLASPRGVC